MSSAHVGDNRGGLPSPALTAELTSGQSYWHKAWGRGKSRTWHEGLRMGQGGHPCILVETRAFHLILITDAKGDKRPVLQREEGTSRGRSENTRDYFGDGSPMPRGRGRGAGLLLQKSCPVTSELPTPFQGDVICEQKLVQGDEEVSPALPISITVRFLSKYWW